MAKETINDRKERFCQLIVQGKTQRQAYYEAFAKSKSWKPATVDNRASNLAKSDEVLARLKELRDEIQEANAVKRSDIIEELKSIGFADIDTDTIKPADKIKALEQICKILGFDKPEAEETSGIVITLQNIDQEVSG